MNTEKRVALVIGNANYDNAAHLCNPINDAVAVSTVLKALGFDLITVEDNLAYNTDLGLIKMARALADFSVAAETARIALFYFAGHGLEVDGKNYLLPRDVSLAHIRRMYFETIKLDDVHAAVGRTGQLRLILLDACRSDPFRVSMRTLDSQRSISYGFAAIEPTGNTGVAYAAKHGTIANDGPQGGNSPFATALIKHLPTPDLEVRLLFGRIRDEVHTLTAGKQEPHFYSNFGGQELYLVHRSLGAKNKRLSTTTKPLDASSSFEARTAATQQALMLWTELRMDETEDTEIIEAYICQFENIPIMLLKAKQRLNAVEAAIRQREDLSLRQKENAEWEAAQFENTEDAFQRYLNTWPYGRHVDLAKGLIHKLQDTAQWKIAVDAGSEPALRAYLNDFPDGYYAEEVKQRLSALKNSTKFRANGPIFISYRRQDTIAVAGRIFDRLDAKFGAGRVFMDIDAIPAGVDFHSFLSDTVSRASIVLVLIGPNWVEMVDVKGHRRLDNPDDFVRIEIEAALKLSIPIVPVLIGGATMPSPDELPESLRPLVRRNAALIDVGRDFHPHMDRLMADLERHLNAS